MSERASVALLQSDRTISHISAAWLTSESDRERRGPERIERDLLDLHWLPVRNDYLAIAGAFITFVVTLLFTYARSGARLLGAVGDPVAIEKLQDELRPRVIRAHRFSHLLIGLWIGAVAGFSMPAIIGYLIAVELFLWGVPRLIPGPPTVGAYKPQRVIYVLPILISGVVVAALARLFVTPDVN